MKQKKNKNMLNLQACFLKGWTLNRSHCTPEKFITTNIPCIKPSCLASLKNLYEKAFFANNEMTISSIGGLCSPALISR